MKKARRLSLTPGPAKSLTNGPGVTIAMDNRADNPRRAARRYFVHSAKSVVKTPCFALFLVGGVHQCPPALDRRSESIRVHRFSRNFSGPTAELNKERAAAIHRTISKDLVIWKPLTGTLASASGWCAAESRALIKVRSQNHSISHSLQ